ncbi:MAG: hypothetical protein J5940_06655 [Clostridia bacterium]|nr:hypothetical protein [Clostridia bacterium]
MVKKNSKASDMLITVGSALVPAAFGGVFFLFLKDQELVSPLYIVLGALSLTVWGAAGYLCGRRLFRFWRLLIINAVPAVSALITAGMDIYAFFYERTHDGLIGAVYENYYLTESYIGFTGVSFPALIARYMMNITAVNYNIFLVGLMLMITPFAFCYINGFSHELEIRKNVPCINGKDQDETESESAE